MYTIYTRYDPPCSYCTAAKELLKIHDKEFDEVKIDDPETMAWFISQGFKTVPQIFLKEFHIGGFTQLKEHLGEPV